MKRTWTALAFVPLWLLPPLPAAAEAGPVAQLVVPPEAWVELAPTAPGLTAEAALDGGPLQPVDGGLRAPREGDHWLTVASRDPLGNRSPLSWVRLRIDGDAPDLELVIEPPPLAAADGGAWIPPGSIARARAADELAGVASLILGVGDDRRESAGDAVELPLPATGSVVVTAQAEDAVGNTKALRPLALRVDHRAPEGAVTFEGRTVARGDRRIAGPTVVARPRVEDQESGVAETIPRTDGREVGAEGWSGPWEPGTYTLDAIVVDRVGNRGELPAERLEVDAEGPEIRWRVRSEGVEGAGGTVYRPPVTLAAEAVDGAGVATLEWSADGAIWQGLAADGAEGRERTPEGLIETTAASLELRAEDGVGNARRETASWRLDEAAPRWTLRGPGGEVAPGGAVILIQDQSLVLEAVDDAAGIARQRAALHGLRWRETPLEMRFPTRGIYRLEAWAEDRLGHESRVHWWIHVERRGGER